MSKIKFSGQVYNKINTLPQQSFRRSKDYAEVPERDNIIFKIDSRNSGCHQLPVFVTIVMKSSILYANIL